jgi:hypothetical protein
MTANKLQYYIEHGNIGRERCIEIAQAAEEAIAAHSKSRDMKELGLAMQHCCAFDPDEAAFFRAAVDFVLQTKWGANPKDKAVLIVCMDQQYAQICHALKPGSAAPVSTGKPTSSSRGCLIMIGFIGMMPLGYCAARFFIA